MLESIRGQKVAVLVPYFTNSSGDARVAEAQAAKLTRQGNNVSIFALTSDRKISHGEASMFYMSRNSTLRRLYRLLFPFDIFHTLKLVRRLKEFNLVVPHLYPMTYLAYLCKMLYGTRYVFWFHGIEEYWIFPKLHQRVYNLLEGVLTNITIRNADKIASVSTFAQSTLLRRFHLRSDVVYNEIDLNQFHKGLNGKVIRNKLHLSDEGVVLFAGRLAPQKGVHLLLQAFNLVCEKIPKAKLILVGQKAFPEYAKHLERLAASSVIFAGAVAYELMPYFYAACDVYATCSLWEMCPMPVLEAHACGKPVIAFDIPSMREVKSRKSKMDITLIETGDLEAFADTCVGILSRALEQRACNTRLQACNS